MLTTAQFDKVRGASWIDLKTEREVREQFALANLTPMLKLMDQCLADLQKYWNVAALDADRGSAAPRMVNPLARLFNTYDYPNTSIRKGESGTVALIALVDEKDVIRDCTVSQTSGMAALDAQSCAVVTERGKFKPAIDAKGAPLKSWVSAQIRWEMP